MLPHIKKMGEVYSPILSGCFENVKCCNEDSEDTTNCNARN
jgi:hypothetical protein